MAKYKKVDPKELKPGPIRHKQLSDRQLALARFTHERIGRLLHPTFEKWELGFLRDVLPWQELIVWTRLAYALQRYMEKHPQNDHESVAKDLIRLSLGQSPATKRQKELLELCKAVTQADIEAAMEAGTQ